MAKAHTRYAFRAELLASFLLTLVPCMLPRQYNLNLLSIRMAVVIADADYRGGPVYRWDAMYSSAILLGHRLQAW